MTTLKSGQQSISWRRVLIRVRCITAFAVLCLSALACSAQCTGRANLNAFERANFLQVAQGQRSEVFAQFLSEPGCGVSMLIALQKMGALIDYADSKSGYVLVTVSKEKLLAALDIPGIAYAFTNSDDRIYYQDPAAKTPQSERKTEAVPPIVITYPKVATTLPPDGPFFDADVIGLTELWKLHPEADGRGTRVAVPDEGFDLLHPALQEAKDVEGHIAPKVADLGTLNSLDSDSGWIAFGSPIVTRVGTFEAAGRTWTAPEDGAYRFGIFRQDLTLGPEINSKSKKLSLSVGVLWDGKNRVWVDTDGDGSFRNQRALGDFGTAQDTDWFGTKAGNEDNRIPFGIKIDAARNAVYLRIGGEHGMFLGGALAGNKLTGGLFEGAAPNAQLIDENSWRATALASMVRMAARPDVEVINRSGGIGRAGYTGDRAGIEDFAQHVVERAIAVYDKPIATYSAAVGTIHVNDYAGPEMLRRNRQLGPPYKDTINSFVWDLPNGLVNTVLAPSANLETDSRYMPQDIVWPDGVRYMWDGGKRNPPAPDGYVIGANESPAIPVVSGVLADLIGEAKREHVGYTAARLNNAIFTGTRLLPGFPISQQGYGLINAAQSWEQLAKMAKADDPANPKLTSFAVSRVEAGKTVEVQGFHADLANPGQKLDGEIWITRHRGYARGRKYTFALRGNNGVYELLDHEATLERDKPARVRFKTNGASGWNIVFLELRDARADVVMQDVPLSVRVPDAPEKIAPGVDRYESTIQPLSSENRFVRVGEDAQAAHYVMQIPYTGPENISTRDMPGLRYYNTKKTPPGEPVDLAHHVGPTETIESLVINDQPGTQQIFWENRGRPEYATQYDGPAPNVPIHATLTVTKYAIGITKPQSNTISVTNQLAEVDGHVELYDAKFATSELDGLGNHAMAETDFQVPVNLAQWRLRVTGSAKGSHADAYLFNCTGKNGCQVVSQQEITGNGALLVVDNPKAGTWKVVVRSREQVSVEPKYKLNEAQLTPTQIAAPEVNAKHSNGEKWTVALPTTTQYAAFRIAGTPGVEREKNGLLIAMTPLDRNAP
jgi:hypothetical protein